MPLIDGARAATEAIRKSGDTLHGTRKAESRKQPGTGGKYTVHGTRKARLGMRQRRVHGTRYTESRSAQPAKKRKLSEASSSTNPLPEEDEEDEEDDSGSDSDEE